MLTFNSVRPLHDFHPVCNQAIQSPFSSTSQSKNLHKAFSFTIEDCEVHCVLNPDCRPITVFSKGETGRVCGQLSELIDALPQLLKEANLLQLTKIANFLSNGTQYTVIENPKKYIKQYNAMVEEENNSWDLPSYALTRYGIFDVSEIQQPRVENNQLIFYVCSRIPYLATLDFPLGPHPQLKYELLPYL